MNKEQILEMKPGRELDALVAEKVTHFVSLTTAPNFEGTFGYLPPYSTDIVAAWEVANRYWSFDLRKGPDGQLWTFRIIDDEGDIVALSSCETAPLAICRAALLDVLKKEASG